MSLHELRDAISAEWRADARCLGADPEAFFPAKGADGNAARAMCAECPVLEPCRTEGLHVDLPGIWGGLTDKERRALRRRLGIKARPFPTERSGCGTEAGYRRHLRARETACGPCAEAAQVAQRQRRDVA